MSGYLKESGLVSRDLRKTDTRKILKLFPLCSFLTHWRVFFILESQMPSIEQNFCQWFLGVSKTFPTSFQPPFSKSHLWPYLLLHLRMCTFISPCICFFFFTISFCFRSLPANVFAVVYVYGEVFHARLCSPRRQGQWMCLNTIFIPGAKNM